MAKLPQIIKIEVKYKQKEEFKELYGKDKEQFDDFLKSIGWVVDED